MTLTHVINIFISLYVACIAREPKCAGVLASATFRRHARVGVLANPGGIVTIMPRDILAAA